MMERVAYLQKTDEKYYMDYYVEVDREDEDNVLVGSFHADRIVVDRIFEDDDNTSGYVILHVGEDTMEFIADKIEGMDNLNKEDFI